MQAITSSAAAATASKESVPEKAHFTNLPQDVVAEIFSYLEPKKQIKAVCNRFTYECFNIPRIVILERIWRESMSKEGISAEAVIASWSLPCPEPLLITKGDSFKYEIRPNLLPSLKVSLCQRLLNSCFSKKTVIDDDPFTRFCQKWNVWVWSHRSKVLERHRLFREIFEEDTSTTELEEFIYKNIKNRNYDYAIWRFCHIYGAGTKIPSRCFEDREFAKLIVAVNGKRIVRFPLFYNDPEILITALTKWKFEQHWHTVSNLEGRLVFLYKELCKTWATEEVTEEYKRKIIALMLCVDGRLLGELTEFQDDIDMVRIAVSENGRSIKYASERLRDNSEIAELAVRYLGFDANAYNNLGSLEMGYYSAFCYLSKRLQRDPRIKQLAKKACSPRPYATSLVRMPRINNFL